MAEEDLTLQFGVAWRENDRNETLREFLIPVREHAANGQKKLDDIWASRSEQQDWASNLDHRSWDTE